jgi:hypothetical protein
VRNDSPAEIRAALKQLDGLELGRWGDRDLWLSAARGIETGAQQFRFDDHRFCDLVKGEIAQTVGTETEVRAELR